MKQTFELSGVHCEHCMARVKNALAPLAEHVEVTLSPALAVLTVKEKIPLSKINEVLSEAGDYSAKELD